MNNKSKSLTAVLNFKMRKLRNLAQKKLKGTIMKIKSLIRSMQASEGHNIPSTVSVHISYLERLEKRGKKLDVGKHLHWKWLKDRRKGAEFHNVLLLPSHPLMPTCDKTQLRLLAYQLLPPKYRPNLLQVLPSVASFCKFLQVYKPI